MCLLVNNVFVLLLTLILFINLFNNAIKCCELNSTHALILARAGSKGIKNKNLLLLDDITILGRTIETIKASGSFAQIWVSTDSTLIEKEAIKYGAWVYRRSSANAQDNSSSIAAVEEFLEKHYFIERFALFQCTSPFLRVSYIKEAVQKFTSYPDSQCVFAVKRNHDLRWSYEVGRDGRNKELRAKVKPLNFQLAQRPRRQAWEGELVETGMFYFSTRQLIQKGLLQDESCQVVEIASKDALELDTYGDVQIAKCLLNV